MLYDYMMSHPLVVKQQGTTSHHGIWKAKQDSDYGIFKVKDNESKDCYKVVVRFIEDGEVSCNCKFHWSFNLYCAHIFAVFNILQIKSVNKFRRFSRWTREYQD